MPNSLIKESSPYLLQHANNPVNWYAWNNETLELAIDQNKLMIVSIGYSACHWCHVMEHECFENPIAAEIMNKYFICIKVDREERPDIDAVYMQALQLMTGQGGWPLNCITLPNGKPIYGGTYFPLQKWIDALENLANIFQNKKQIVLDYAEKLAAGIAQAQLFESNATGNEFTQQPLANMLKNWRQQFDFNDGGMQRVPKFPMPDNYQFLLQYGTLSKDISITNHVYFTLDKMALGGIYDQVGGGFCRYSTDELWKVPHFEKMLYDNAQLVILYCDAFAASKKELYKEVVYQTLAFVTEELTDATGAFYCALDADSEGIEGKYYVWTREELIALWGINYDVLAAYFNINETGYWEHNNYILFPQNNQDEAFALHHKLEINEWKKIKNEALIILKSYRNKRVKPGLDDKSLTSWNAMMMQAYAHASLVFNEPKFLNVAIKNATFIISNQLKADGSLYHSYKNGKSTINAFLEDYALLAKAFITLYVATSNEMYLIKSKELTDYALAHFNDSTSELLFFTSINDAPLISRQKEVHDNVIPSSNAVMANVLNQLYWYFEDENYLTHAKKMMLYFEQEMQSYGSSYSHWAQVYCSFVYPQKQVAIIGTNTIANTSSFFESYFPNTLIYNTNKNSILPFLKHKQNNQNSYFVCANKVCSLPLSTLSEAINHLKEN